MYGLLLDKCFFLVIAGLINVMDFIGYLCCKCWLCSPQPFENVSRCGASVTFLFLPDILPGGIGTNGFDLITILAKILLNRFF